MKVGWHGMVLKLRVRAMRLTVAAVLWLCVVSAQAAETNGLVALQERLSNHVAQARFAAAMLGIEVGSLENGKTYFEHNSRKLLKPASNNKLYTGALALDRLGPEFRIKTSLLAAARPDAQGALRGDLIVYGRGDPSFCARFRDGSYNDLLGPLADKLLASGVKIIEGDLVGDESFFSGPPIGATWTWDDLQSYYGAEVSALTVQDNVVDLVFRPGRIGAPVRMTTLPAVTPLIFSNRTETVAARTNAGLNLYRPIGENLVYVSGRLGTNVSSAPDSVSVHQPARWFLTLLREALNKRGVKVAGELRLVNWLDRQVTPLDLKSLVELGSVESPPLGEIVHHMMKPSQNLYAQLLLLQVGRHVAMKRNDSVNTEDIGLAELQKFLAEAGVRKGEALIEEGSGLSRGALVTPHATATLLRYMDKHRHAGIFRDSLPIAGVDGTLKNRLKSTAATGNLRAKTGTLRYVNTLSGYVTNRSGERLVFSIMLNNFVGAGGGRAEVDALGEMLAESVTR